MQADEKISIRECSRRLKVSDTAVHKAIKTGRVTVVGRTESGRPLVGWPLAETQWRANTDPSQQRKSVAGTEPAPPARRKPATPPAAPPPSQPDAEPRQPAPAEESAGQAAVANAPSFAQSRAIREAYQARLAKLEFEERSRRLVSVDVVKADAFKAARSTRDAILNIPDRIAMELAHETDPARVHKRLVDELRTALESLAGAAA